MTSGSYSVGTPAKEVTIIKLKHISTITNPEARKHPADTFFRAPIHCELFILVVCFGKGNCLVGVDFNRLGLEAYLDGRHRLDGIPLGRWAFCIGSCGKDG